LAGVNAFNLKLFSGGLNTVTFQLAPDLSGTGIGPGRDHSEFFAAILNYAKMNHEPLEPIPAPSTRLKGIQFGGLTFGYPEDWKIQGQPNNGVVIAPTAGALRLFGSGVAYQAGLVVETHAIERNSTFEKSATKWLEEMRKGGGYDKPQGNPASEMLNGVPALQLGLRSQNGTSAWATALNTGGSVTILWIYFQEQRGREFEPALRSILNSIRSPGSGR
jgi:hypothetical protein